MFSGGGGRLNSPALSVVAVLSEELGFALLVGDEGWIGKGSIGRIVNKYSIESVLCALETRTDAFSLENIIVIKRI